MFTKKKKKEGRDEREDKEKRKSKERKIKRDLSFEIIKKKLKNDIKKKHLKFVFFSELTQNIKLQKKTVYLRTTLTCESLFPRIAIFH